MNYPLISEYIEAIKSAEDNFEELSYLRPVLGDDGLPVMTGGNFAEVFKMRDERSGKFYAVKCFTKEQEGRAEAYREIAKELEKVSSPYILSIRYLEKELFVDTDQTTETEFPVLLMDWVEGKTLDKYLRENLDDKYALEMLAYRFSLLAQWLIPQPFAHGDLKPDNILVREDGTLVLVDYDGMYVPAMKGQKARELGSPDFRHPLRIIDDFDNRIDDFPLLSIIFSLVAIAHNPELLEEFGAADRLLLSESDYRRIDQSLLLKRLFPNKNNDINNLLAVLLKNCLTFPFRVKINLDKIISSLDCSFHPIFSSYVNRTAISVMREGYCKFDSFSEALIILCGYDVVPYLRCIYNSLRDYPGCDCLEEMTPSAEMQSIKLDAILESIPDSMPFFRNTSDKKIKAFDYLSLSYWKQYFNALLGEGKEKADAQFWLFEDYESGYLTVDFSDRNKTDICDDVSVLISQIDKTIYSQDKNINEWKYFFLKESAMSGHIRAQFRLADFYKNGPQKYQDELKAKKWLDLACYNYSNSPENIGEYFRSPYRTIIKVFSPEEIEGIVYSTTIDGDN